MPKLKTHKGAQSRFHVTGTGKIMRSKQGKSHLRRHKSKRVKGLFDEMVPLHPSFRRQIQKLIPYGAK
ncbi:MAG: 50S ribosomal protein L35 [Chloroflexi bacterium]|nr:50S ribosomal protein L35 [Chloroflexota bacterium]